MRGWEGLRRERGEGVFVNDDPKRRRCEGTPQQRDMQQLGGNRSQGGTESAAVVGWAGWRGGRGLRGKRQCEYQSEPVVLMCWVPSQARSSHQKTQSAGSLFEEGGENGDG